MAAPIEFWFDFISPYGYLAATRVDDLAARYGRTTNWRPLLLGITVLKVMGLKALPDTPLKQDYIQIDQPRLAKLLGVPFQRHGLKNVNSLAASRAFLWLKARDPALAIRFAHRIYVRLFVAGKDITPPEAVAEEARAVGVDPAGLLAAIETDTAKAALKASVDEAIARKIFGVPTFVVDGEPIWGVDRLWMLEHWLQHGEWTALPSASVPAP
jgi:2-hydroxychromene-2-carboxylate isomerase